MNQYLDWNWSGKSARGIDIGWDATIEHFVVDAQTGQDYDEILRGSIGYGNYSLLPLLMVVDVARHVGYAQDLANYQTASGKKLRTVTEHFTQYLDGGKPNPYPDREKSSCNPPGSTATGSGYQCYDQTLEEYRAAYELPHKFWPDSYGITKTVNAGGDKARGDHFDNHITTYNAVVGMPY